MQLDFSSTTSYPIEMTSKAEVKTSHAHDRSTSFTNEKKIDSIEQRLVVDTYFKVFEKEYSELAIKNLIAARLQPSSALANIHNNQELSLKSKELLDFSLIA